MASLSALSASLCIQGTHQYVRALRGRKFSSSFHASAVDTLQADHVAKVDTAAPNIFSEAKPPIVHKVDGTDNVNSGIRFTDERWKKGTWDLNMFVKDGMMDWDSVISAEAKRRKFLEKFPEASSNEEPVLFRTSIIPWWAWIARSHLPEAELLNGRAAMLGFFMAYLVDILTGLDMVGQTGNFFCKTGLLVTVLGVILLRRRQDFENLKKLADEATFYDKQWQASWQDKDVK